MDSIDVDVIRTALDWLERGRRATLGTVVRTWGSAPRPPGSMMVIRDDGQVAGSVSGGCIEGAVITEALEVMHGLPPRVLGFGVSDEAAWEVGLACGGKVEVLVEAVL